MVPLLRHSHFPSDPFGDGGAKRTAQISEILNENGLSSTFYDPDVTKIFKRPLAALDGIRMLTKHEIQTKKNKEALTQLGFNYYKRLKTMEYYGSRHHLLLWESNRQKNVLMAYAAKDAGLAVISLPHNLESLVPGQISEFTGKEAPHWWNEELQALSMCDHIFTISREEQWLLKLFNLKADYLPYFPPKEMVSYLLKIREKRKNTSSGRMILLLGTAGNTPTFTGMIDRINYFHNAVKRKDIELHVAGFLTEMLKDHIPKTDNIILHGTVSQQKLEDLLFKCKMVWIHQDVSTGSLTRIPEMLLAGIPLLLNGDAGRTYHNMKGLNVYETEEKCKEMMSNVMDMEIETDLPAKPLKFESRFLDVISNLNEA